MNFLSSESKYACMICRVVKEITSKARKIEI
jgi:hypothetical protein